jgi:transcriptional regulator with PAS, ATPase and Fis domain
MMLNYPARPLIGCSAKVEEMRDEIARTAPTNATVMVRGEPGTGKDLVAQEIHLKSDRSNGAFVKVNCGALPEDLVESELFGCERGAFTGAVFRKGKFELANKGTIFLDEIGELSMRAQAKLLQVTETPAVDRLGGQHSIPVDFRLIVATNQNLEDMIRDGKFRSDLYYRLNMDMIRTPPLRERLDDIPLLVDYFIGCYVADARRLVTGAAPQVIDLLQQYSWPGNIRELQNVIRKAVFKGKNEVIRLEDLPFDFGQRTAAPPITLGNYQERMQEHSCKLVSAALKHCQGDRTQAAKLLGLSRSRFYDLVKLHGLDGKPGNNGQEPGWFE